jgi:hypothetical protein
MPAGENGFMAALNSLPSIFDSSTPVVSCTLPDENRLPSNLAGSSVLGKQIVLESSRDFSFGQNRGKTENNLRSENDPLRSVVCRNFFAKSQNESGQITTVQASVAASRLSRFTSSHGMPHEGRIGTSGQCLDDNAVGMRLIVVRKAYFGQECLKTVGFVF